MYKTTHRVMLPDAERKQEAMGAALFPFPSKRPRTPRDDHSGPTLVLRTVGLVRKDMVVLLGVPSTLRVFAGQKAAQYGSIYRIRLRDYLASVI